MNILIPISQASDRERFGGKSANLAFLSTLGLNVPDGAVVPADELARHIDGASACAVRSELAAELRELVIRLGGRVSVRSSATLEDAKTHSFAGQFLTVLDVGVDGVETAVQAVWASTLRDNVRAYLRRAELDPAALRMAVVVQRQIDSEASGVAMGTANGAVVEAVFGQGEALVSGAVAADRWEIEAGRVVKTRLANKSSRIGVPQGPPTGALVRVALGEAQRSMPSLDEQQLNEVAAAYMRIAEACGGRPQDCEFAFADGSLYLLQTRDVTASLPLTAPPLGDFSPPDKGAWEIDSSHFSRPCTPMFQEQFARHMPIGFKKTTARYGALLSHFDYRFVNGFAYNRMRLVAAPADANAKAPPPTWLFKLLLKVVPALRRRVRTAERIWETHEWRTELAEWQQTKARVIEAHLRLQSVDLDALDDAELAAHFSQVYAHAGEMIETHHTYNLAAILPLGDLLCQATAWNEGKLGDADVFTVLTGAAPLAADLRSDDARETGAALAADDEASRLLALEVPDAVITDHRAADALAKLRALPGGAGERARRFLAMREVRLVEGLDPGTPCLRECPSLLWQALRTAALLAQTPAQQSAEIDKDALARVRASVPAARHAELDALIAEARALTGLREERGLYTDVWAWGILRTTVLAIGRRVLRRSPALLCDPADLLYASADDVLSLLAGSTGPSATELGARAAFARAYTTSDAPPTLGPKAAPPPSFEHLPPGLRRVMTCAVRLIPLMLAPPPARTSEAGLRGVAASSGVWEGPAHIVSSHDDAKDIPVGAVLVVGGGSAVFTMMAPLASAVVAEGGGLLSHVAIVCREYRIPCVCGVPDVLASLENGQRIRVDGTRGVVEVVAG